MLYGKNTYVIRTYGQMYMLADAASMSGNESAVAAV